MGWGGGGREKKKKGGKYKGFGMKNSCQEPQGGGPWKKKQWSMPEDPNNR